MSKVTKPMENGGRLIGYKTHILIGVSADGAMAVICDWPHLPTLAEVQEQIDATHGGYAAFALCTPTSILPVQESPSGRGRARSVR
jgi:hypothetical protein